MSWLVSIFLVFCFTRVARHYWLRIDEDNLAPARRSFLAWAGKGLGIPILLWIVFNSGILPGLPALMPEIEMARSAGGSWVPRFLGIITVVALLVVGSCWTGVTFGWLVTAVFGRIQPDHRKEFISVAVFWSALLLPFSWLILHFGGWFTIGLAAMVWLLPMVHFTLPLLAIKKLPPLYSRAIANLKFGKFNEAEWEVIRELEKCEDDFEGWMMLAALYAVHFRDLTVAEQTIRDLCAQPNLNASQIAVALHRLADWHLRVGEDPVSARRALEQICQRAPGTHVDRMARLRLSRLPATREALREQREGKPIRLPAFSSQLDEAAPAPAPEMSKEQAAARANQCVEKLKQDPNNVPAREELARILAERLGQCEPAVEQMELLLAMPDQPERKRAEWLSLMAAWQLQDGRDPEAARKLLERLIHDHPQSPQAFAAQRRVALMEAEARFRRVRAASIRLPSKQNTPDEP